MFFNSIYEYILRNKIKKKIHLQHNDYFSIEKYIPVLYTVIMRQNRFITLFIDYPG